MPAHTYNHVRIASLVYVGYIARANIALCAIKTSTNHENTKNRLITSVTLRAALGGERRHLSGAWYIFFYELFVPGARLQFIDGINLNLTHVCVCEILLVLYTLNFVFCFIKQFNIKKRSIRIWRKKYFARIEPALCSESSLWLGS